MIVYDITSASRVGCVRRQNEDMILVDNHYVRNDDHAIQVSLNNQDRYIVAVADGMGGHNRGDVASNDVLKNLQFYYHDLPSGLGASEFYEAMIEWLDSINNIVASKGRADEQYQGMGTTLVALAYYMGDFYTLNCGDSRLYRFADGAREARDVLLLPRLRPQNTVGRAARAAGGQFDGLLYHDGDAAFVYPDTLAFVCGRRDLRPCNQRLSLRRRGKVDRISSARADRLCEKRNARRGGRKSFKRKSACKF